MFCADFFLAELTGNVEPGHVRAVANLRTFVTAASSHAVIMAINDITIIPLPILITPTNIPRRSILTYPIITNVWNFTLVNVLFAMFAHVAGRAAAEGLVVYRLLDSVVQTNPFVAMVPGPAAVAVAIVPTFCVLAEAVVADVFGLAFVDVGLAVGA